MNKIRNISEAKIQAQPTNLLPISIQTQQTNTINSLKSDIDTINIAKLLPCETVENIIVSVFDKKESFWEPIDSVLNKNFSIESFLKSQEEEDELTKKIYKKSDENDLIIFPQKKRKCNIPPHIWKIWEQTSRYHKETILEHIAMVIAWVSKETNNDINMQLVALLHDAWKKYTTWTNQKWELCFYDHEKVSAYLAAIIYRQLWFSKEEAEPYIRIIHDHLLPFNEWSKDQSKKEKYRELYGDYITNAITILNQNDIWITEEDETDSEKRLQKAKLIQEGNFIIDGLTTENFQKTETI